MLLAAAVGVMFPPTNPSAWTRAANNPVLSPTEPWEGNCVCENVAMRDEGKWKMWYRGGWGTQCVGLAFSDDGLHWEKANNGKPVYGCGSSGSNSTVSGGQPWVFRVNSTTLFLYSTVTEKDVKKVNLMHSTDGINWIPLSSSIPIPPNGFLWGNRVVWREDGDNWKMLQEATTHKSGIWEIFLYTSNDGQHWSVQNNGNPLTSLSRGGMYGGPRVANIEGKVTPFYNGSYHIFFHASKNGDLPTDIYHATSLDLINWDVTPSTPVITHLGTGYEYDQVAGPVPLIVNGTAYIFYDGDNNAHPGARIGVVTSHGN